MKKVLIGLVILSASLASGQEKFPRPYLNAGIDLEPAGYASLAVQGGGGIMLESPHFVFDSYAGYDNGRKVNDGTGPNPKGNDKFLRGFAAYKQGPWFAGIGARWSSLSTSNYTKGGDIFNSDSWHPEVGGGRDWDARTAPLFLRTQALWMFREQREVVRYPDGTTCYGCGNGSEGVDMTLWFPSPAHKGHWFCKMNFVFFGFHSTFTDPKNVALTRAEAANKSVSGSEEYSINYRW